VTEITTRSTKCYRQKDCCSKNVFKWRLKDCNVGAEMMCSGREFQIWATATGKARLPTVDSLTGGTTSRLIPAERSARSTRDISSRGERSQVPWCITMENSVVSTAILNWIRSGTRSQCRLMWLHRAFLVGCSGLVARLTVAHKVQRVNQRCRQWQCDNYKSHRWCSNRSHKNLSTSVDT